MESTRKVLISPGYGAGWSTWGDNAYRSDYLFDDGLIAAVEAGDDIGNENDPSTPLGAFKARLVAKGGEKYYSLLGADQLEVVTVYGPFQVDEYDGHESIRCASDQEWL